MQRLFSLSLVLLLLYHMVGQAVICWTEEAVSNPVVATSSAVVELIVPLQLNDYTVSGSVESAKGGEFAYQGKFYTILNQTIENGQMKISCVENTQKLERHKQLKDFVQKNTSGSQESGKHASLSKIWVKDYAQFASAFVLFLFEDSIQPTFPPYQVAFTCICTPSLTEPPVQA